VGHDDAPARLATLFREHGDFVFRMLARFGVPDAQRDDLVQEVFLVAHRKRDAYQDRDRARPWLLEICRRVAADARRAGRRRNEREADPPPGILGREPIDPEQGAERTRAAEFVQRFLDELDGERRAVFVLCDIEGFTAPEVAVALEINLNTVYSRLRVARERFQEAVRARAEGQGEP
jgi:RNA polymerase sigma-70 factor (ECF subfamily)